MLFQQDNILLLRALYYEQVLLHRECIHSRIDTDGGIENDEGGIILIIIDNNYYNYYYYRNDDDNNNV